MLAEDIDSLHSDAEASSSPESFSPQFVCFQYQLYKLQEEENRRYEVDDFEGAEPAVDVPAAEALSTA